MKYPFLSKTTACIMNLPIFSLFTIQMNLFAFSFVRKDTAKSERDNKTQRQPGLQLPPCTLGSRDRIFTLICGIAGGLSSIWHTAWEKCQKSSLIRVSASTHGGQCQSCLLQFPPGKKTWQSGSDLRNNSATQSCSGWLGQQQSSSRKASADSLPDLCLWNGMELWLHY